MALRRTGSGRGRASAVTRGAFRRSGNGLPVDIRCAAPRQDRNVDRGTPAGAGFSTSITGLPVGARWSQCGAAAGRAEEGRGHEDDFGMVPQRAVPKIRDDCFAGIEPAMDRQTGIDLPALFSHQRQRMMIRMRHRSPQNTCWVYSEISIRSLKLSVTVRSATSKTKSP